MGKLGQGRMRTFNLVSIIFVVLSIVFACFVFFQLVAG